MTHGRDASRKQTPRRNDVLDAGPCSDALLDLREIRRSREDCTIRAFWTPVPWKEKRSVGMPLTLIVSEGAPLVHVPRTGRTKYIDDPELIAGPSNKDTENLTPRIRACRLPTGFRAAGAEWARHVKGNRFGALSERPPIEAGYTSRDLYDTSAHGRLFLDIRMYFPEARMSNLTWGHGGKGDARFRIEGTGMQ
ncbi:hypothetical protein BS47DRAFT_1358917 [Hydnum rufescens UP504]|uniref:Uncharacterized protein n=1 Tax=Hydnum rufescens UP504 TaxID=1448309 RepID=A0A9P6B7K2_9AGAM|nr:hypothetical protein BS47DRAFT_1358917 [Hydnum rufescens UP504]